MARQSRRNHGSRLGSFSPARTTLWQNRGVGRNQRVVPNRKVGNSEAGAASLIAPKESPSLFRRNPSSVRSLCMLQFLRIIWVVLDSVGIGPLPDAADYGDTGRNTLGHIAQSRPLLLPILVELGIGNIAPLANLPPVNSPKASFGKGATHSPGKDTTTGHWEMAGIWLPQAFPVYKQGFPRELIEQFEHAIGRKTIGNKPASGTEIIKELGEEHVRTGFPIVYTSGDSVFQIAAHEGVIPIAELYRMCEIARKLLDGPNRVGRVIARPFAGTPGNFRRTERRHDYAVEPPRPMLLDALAEAQIPVFGVGKIHDIYNGRGVEKF